MQDVVNNAEDLYKTRNYIINALEGGEPESDNLLCVSVDKLKEIKNEYDQDKKFQKDKNTKRSRETLEEFISKITDKKIYK